MAARGAYPRADALLEVDEGSSGEKVHELSADGVGEEGIQTVPMVGIQVRGKMFIGATTFQRFDDNAQTCFTKVLAKLCFVPVSDVKITGIKQVDQPAAVPLDEVASSGGEKTSRRLLQEGGDATQLADDNEGVDVEFAITGVLSAGQGKAIAEAITLAVGGGENSKMRTEYFEERQNFPTLHQNEDTKFTVKTSPLVIGVPAPSGAAGSCLQPKWCPGYLSKPLEAGTASWKADNECKPTASSYEEALVNIDGVICACKGVKVVQRKHTKFNADLQSISVIRGQGAKQNKYKAYSYQIIAPTSDAKPSADGLELRWEFERQHEEQTDGRHRILRRMVKVKFTHLVEYQDYDHAESINMYGTGLRDNTTRHLDPQNGNEKPGLNCDGAASISGKNCIVQDFYLDNFEEMSFSESSVDRHVTATSNVQGTSPWCKKQNGDPDCQTAPFQKPLVVFDFKFAKKSHGSDIDFANTELTMDISNFPFKYENSSLAVGVTMYSLDTSEFLGDTDKTFEPSAVDELDCSSVPPPSGCPSVTLDRNLHFNWAKSMVDGTSANITYKVVTSTPVAVPAGTEKDRQGTALPSQRFWFATKPSKAFYTQWKMGFHVNKLPETIHSGAGRLTPGFSVVLCVIVAVHCLYGDLAAALR